ncbi:MAG: hypothetical protein KDK70_27565, partial [Myxococcales bacterium]|nr:hypothetical protein [Myxococcales bacterium]
GSAASASESDGGRTRPPARRKRDTSTCYYQQDSFKYIQRERKHSRFVLGRDGRCYDCADEAPDYRRAQLSPSDCARYYLCVHTGEEQCVGL